MDSGDVVLEVDSSRATTRRERARLNWKSEEDDLIADTHTVSPGIKCLLHVTSPKKVLWDLFILVLAVWNCFYVPYTVAFLPKHESLLLFIIDVAIDAVYIADIAVYSRSSYLDLNTGEEVVDGNRIVRNYLTSGKVVVDVLSAIPFDIVTWETSSQEELQLITLSKIVRMLRISKIVMFLQTKSHVKLKLKLTQLVFFFLAYVHLVACLWFLVTNACQVYTPPGLYIMHHPGLYSSSNMRKYAYSLYMSVYMLTGAEIGPRTEWERVFAAVAIITGQLFQAFMFGEIAVVLSDLNLKSQKISEIQAATATTMMNMKLSRQQQRKVLLYLVSSQGSVLKQTEFEELFASIPPSLKQEVRSLIFAKMIAKNVVLSKRQEMAESILTRLSNMYCRPEEKIIIQGAEATALYFVASGRCEVWVLDEYRVPHESKSLGTGAHFGEVALVFPTPRTASVTSSTHSSIAVLSKSDFAAVCHKNPKTLSLFTEFALHYRDQWKHFLKLTLRRCPFLRTVPGGVLNSIIPLLPTSRIEANTLLYREGERVDTITFIIEGRVEVYITVNDSMLKYHTTVDSSTRELRVAKDGRRKSIFRGNRDMRYMEKLPLEYLGMGSVMNSSLVFIGEKSSVTAVATETTIVMSLTMQQLQLICEKSSEVKAAVTTFKGTCLGAAGQQARTRRMQQSALDYERSFLPSPAGSESLWTAKMKLKRCALGKLLEKREIRAKGFPDFFNLSRKLKAILEAEIKGDFALAEKIRVGTLLSSMEDLAAAFRLLEVQEVTNPILTQFALEAAKVSECLGLQKAKVLALAEEIEKFGMILRKTERAFANTQLLGDLAARLTAPTETSTQSPTQL